MELKKSHEKIYSEKELLNSIQRKGKFNFEKCVSLSKTRLSRQIGRNGDNLYDLLVHLISILLDDPTLNPVDHFEEYCRKAKMDFLSPEWKFQHRLIRPGQPATPVAVEEQAKHLLNALTKIESENIRFCPEFNVLMRCGLNAMGWDLPAGYDYFINAQIVRTLRQDSDAKSCQFWGIMRSLGCDYYILELEHREKSVDYCAHQGVIGKHPEIITDIVDELIKGTTNALNTPSEVSVGNESIEMIKQITQPMLLEMIGNIEIVDRDIEEEHCRAHIDALLTEMIQHVSSRESLEASTASLSEIGDPCTSAQHRFSMRSTASLLRIKLERIQVETRLNNRSFLVTQDPRIKPWYRLPKVTLEQLESLEGLRVFLVGNLHAPVRSIVKRFDGQEENLLRALIAKISAHRDGHIHGSETNISLVKCLSGFFGSVTGYDQELLQERVERWSERKENDMQYWTSETWPGLCTFNDGARFRSIYFGWGLEKESHWYSPVVRIPNIKDEYVPEPEHDDDSKRGSNETFCEEE